MDHMESFSSVIQRATNKDFTKDVFDDPKKTSKFEFSEDAASKSIACMNHEDEMISIEQSCQVSEFVNSDDDPTLLDDVKVCDICGDAGREDLLAVCSKCGDGAEHIYCMRTMLDKIPEDDWMCEECVLAEDKAKMTKTELEQFATSGKYTASNQSYKGDEISKGSGLKVLPQMNSKRLVINKTRGRKLSSLSSADRISNNRVSALMRKRIGLGTRSRPSLTSRDSETPQTQNFTIKTSDELSMPNDLSSRTRIIQEKAAFPSISGNLTKSKSFNGSDKRRKVLLLDEIPQNHLSSETHKKKKVPTVRTLRKSVSFNDASSGRSSTFVTKVQRIPPKFCEDGDVNRLRYTKEHDSVEMRSKYEFNRPQVGPPENGPCFPDSSCDEAFALLGETRSANVCETRCHSAEGVQSTRDSELEGSNKSKLKKLCLPADDVIQNLQSSTGCDASEVVRKGETIYGFSSLKAPLSISDAIEEDKPASQKGSSSQTEKAPQKSNYSFNSTDSMAKGSGAEYRSQNDTPRTRLADSSSVSIIDGAMVKDKSGSSQMNLATPLYNQLATSAFPKFDYIWKGEFEIPRSGRLPRVLYRIQAHLSTQSSPRIPEAVKKFSNKIHLEEVSRLNAWPAQFQERHPQDGSIGLYFFAEDIKSYGNYKSLLHCMIDHDLALRGDINGVEVLIFSSNLLSEGSQYWNGFLFLWGVFKCRKVDGLQTLQDNSLNSRPVI